MGANDFPIINDETLPSIIEGEVARAIGHWDGSLSEARANEFNYYYGKPFGNEMEGVRLGGTTTSNTGGLSASIRTSRSHTREALSS